MTEISDSVGYLAGFAGKERQALKEAIGARKLELDLYWRRASYFWTLSTVAFTGFFVLAASDTAPSGSLVIVSCLGLLFGLGWLLVGRGAKHWQENREIQVDLLEDNVIGPLFKTNTRPTSPALNPLGSYPYSVTKINQILSLFVTLVWLVLVIQSSHRAGPGFSGTLTAAGAVLILTGLFTVLMLLVARSSRKGKRPVALTRRVYQ